MVAAQRQHIVEDIDGASSQKPDDDDDDDDEHNARDLRVASIDAIAKFTDYSKRFGYRLFTFVLSFMQWYHMSTTSKLKQLPRIRI